MVWALFGKINPVMWWVFFLFFYFLCALFGYLYFRYFLVCKCYLRLHPSSIWCRGLNPRPLDHEPSALTTRPWLSPYDGYCLPCYFSGVVWQAPNFFIPYMCIIISWLLESVILCPIVFALSSFKCIIFFTKFLSIGVCIICI